MHYFVIHESLMNIDVVYSNMESLMKHESCSIKSAFEAACLVFSLLLVIAGYSFSPLVTNGLSHPYYFDQSIFIFGTAGVIFYFISFFLLNSCKRTE